MEVRECPNGWTGCDICAKQRECIAGLYHGEDNTAIIKAAETVEKIMHKEVVETVEKIKGMQSDNDFWKWWGRTSPPNIHSKEPIPLDGPSAPGGGKSGRVKKSKKGNKPTVYVWGETL